MAIKQHAKELVKRGIPLFIKYSNMRKEQALAVIRENGNIEEARRMFKEINERVENANATLADLDYDDCDTYEEFIDHSHDFIENLLSVVARRPEEFTSQQLEEVTAMMNELISIRSELIGLIVTE